MWDLNIGLRLSAYSRRSWMDATVNYLPAVYTCTCTGNLAIAQLICVSCAWRHSMPHSINALDALV